MVDRGTVQVTPTSKIWTQIQVIFNAKFTEPPVCACYLYNHQYLNIDMYMNVLPTKTTVGFVFYQDTVQVYDFVWMAIGKGITT